jgi:hypothetical protein
MVGRGDWGSGEGRTGEGVDLSEWEVDGEGEWG